MVSVASLANWFKDRSLKPEEIYLTSELNDELPRIRDLAGQKNVGFVSQFSEEHALWTSVCGTTKQIEENELALHGITERRKTARHGLLRMVARIGNVATAEFD